MRLDSIAIKYLQLYTDYKLTYLLGFNLLNYNVITVSLARTYRGEYRLRPSRLGAIPPSPVG